MDDSKLKRQEKKNLDRPKVYAKQRMQLDKKQKQKTKNYNKRISNQFLTATPEGLEILFFTQYKS